MRIVNVYRQHQNHHAIHESGAEKEIPHIKPNHILPLIHVHPAKLALVKDYMSTQPNRNRKDDHIRGQI
jgi:hypothetical protein